jgi:hypothetical protein
MTTQTSGRECCEIKADKNAVHCAPGLQVGTTTIALRTGRVEMALLIEVFGFCKQASSTVT